METKKENFVPFLDDIISHLHNGSISHQVYRKKTHTDRYLNAISNHHPTKKSIVLKNLVTQATCIYSPQFLSKEKAHITKTLLANGYSLCQINQAFSVLVVEPDYLHDLEVLFSPHWDLIS
jgi:hypothetical protein